MKRWCLEKNHIRRYDNQQIPELSDKPLLQNLEYLTSENKQLHATAQSVTNILTLDN